MFSNDETAAASINHDGLNEMMQVLLQTVVVTLNNLFIVILSCSSFIPQNSDVKLSYDWYPSRKLVYFISKAGTGMTHGTKL